MYLMDDYQELYEYFEGRDYRYLNGFEFYNVLYPERESQGEYQTNYKKPNPVYLYYDSDKGRLRRRIMLKDTWEEDYMDFVEENDLALCSGLTYRGRTNKLQHAQRMNALIFDLDEVGLDEFRVLEGRWDLKPGSLKSIPRPTYTILSGTGVHLYYVFDQPIDLYPNIKIQMKSLKYDLTQSIWDLGETTKEDSIQYQSINQCFRMPGSCNIKNGDRKLVKAFETGEKVTIEWLNQYALDENNRVDVNKPFKPTKYTLEEAKEAFPDWYERVIIKGEKKRKKWAINKKVHGSDPYALYHWWIRQKKKIVGGHRYFFLMCMAIYADKCNVPKKQLVKDMQEIFDEIAAIPHKNELTKDDMKAALEAYSKEYYYTTIEEVNYWTNVGIERNKKRSSNKYSEYMRKDQKTHLQAPYWIKKDGKKVPNDCKVHREFALKIAQEEGRVGRPKKSSKQREMIADYQKDHPDATPKQCMADTGISRNTVYRWWKRNNE